MTALRRRLLHDGWTVSAGDGPHELDERTRIPATVPGCVHTDLLAEGLIDDPFADDNESAQRWIGQTDWNYRTRFDAEPGGADRHDLVFDGLDTVADVRLNGTLVLSARNQHRSHRVDVTDLLRLGGNDLDIRFTSPVRWANAQSAVLGARPRPYPLPYEAIRKSASSFGWDWGIHTATSGIWRPVALESWSTARIDRILLDARPEDAGRGILRADIRIERADPEAELTVSVRLLDERRQAVIPAGGDSVLIELPLEDVQRWWPVGHGEQALYEVDIELLHDGVVVDYRRRRVGFRTVRWDTSPDAHGTGFTLHVNDRPVLVKGVNWIPDDALVTRVTGDQYRRRLAQARDAHVNLVRVWGGGIYESEEFYDICDELGLLTWQDFLFACAAYPEEEPLRSEVEVESREHIVRLSGHASLVLLCGNNENLMGHDDWGWQRSLDGATWGAGYYFDLLPRLVAELAPGTPYIPGSPFHPGGGRANDERHGPVHLWEQWNTDDWRTYRRHAPRFVAEFGWQGPPAWSTLADAVHDAPLTPESPGMLVHQKAAEGNAKLRDGLLAHLPVPREMADWHWAMQWNQAAAIRFALGHFRSTGITSGTIVWQLNDCWPVTSWSAIDSAGRRKPLWHALRQAYSPREIVVDEDARTVTLLNDTDQAWTGPVRLRRLAFDGTELARSEHQARVRPRSIETFTIDDDVAEPVHPGSELIVVDLGHQRGLGWFAEPRSSALEPAAIESTVAATPEGATVTVVARNLVRDLSLLVDRAHPDATVDRALVTLLPGESAQFAITAVSDPAALQGPLVMRSVNDLVRNTTA